MLTTQEYYELTQILLETEGDFEYAIEYALLNDKVEMFNFLHSLGARPTYEAMVKHRIRTIG